MLEDGTAYPRSGKLQFRDVTVDPMTGSVVLRMVFPNPDATLLPGMFVRAIVEEGVADKAILAPQQGVTRDPKGNASVMVVSADGKAAVRPVVVDRTIGDRWLVSSGLAEGDQVIVDGLQKIRPDVPVKAVPSGRHPRVPGRLPADPRPRRSEGAPCCPGSSSTVPFSPGSSPSS